MVGHELLTGEPPFGRGAPAVVMSAILRDPPAVLEMEGIPESTARDLADLFTLMLAKERDTRPLAGVAAGAITASLADPMVASAATTSRHSGRQAPRPAIGQGRTSRFGRELFQWSARLLRSWGAATGLTFLAGVSAVAWFRRPQGEVAAPPPVLPVCVEDYHSALDVPAGSYVVDFESCEDCDCCDHGLIPTLATRDCISCAGGNAIRAAGLVFSGGISVERFGRSDEPFCEEAPVERHVGVLQSKTMIVTFARPVTFFGLALVQRGRTYRSKSEGGAPVKLATVLLVAKDKYGARVGGARAEYPSVYEEDDLASPTDARARFVGVKSCGSRPIFRVDIQFSESP